MSRFKTLDDIGEVRGRRVLVREDLNVPMDGARVTDDTRLRAAAPTLAELSDRGAIVLVLAHFGRPKGQRNPDMSLALVTKPLGAVLGREGALHRRMLRRRGGDGDQVVAIGDIAVLENTRFHDGEEQNDPALATAIARLGDYYVNDAFLRGASRARLHRGYRAAAPGICRPRDAGRAGASREGAGSADASARRGGRRLRRCRPSSRCSIISSTRPIIW